MNFISYRKIGDKESSCLIFVKVVWKVYVLSNQANPSPATSTFVIVFSRRPLQPSWLFFRRDLNFVYCRWLLYPNASNLLQPLRCSLRMLVILSTLNLYKELETCTSWECWFWLSYTHQICTRNWKLIQVEIDDLKVRESFLRRIWNKERS